MKTTDLFKLYGVNMGYFVYNFNCDEFKTPPKSAYHYLPIILQ